MFCVHWNLCECNQKSNKPSSSPYKIERVKKILHPKLFTGTFGWEGVSLLGKCDSGRSNRNEIFITV